MNLTDFINGEPVRCFYTPLYDSENGVKYTQQYMHGENRIFDNGDYVPCKTLYYDYKNNFMIIDYDFSKTSPLIHIIRDSKIFKSIFLENLIDSDFVDIEKVIDYKGNELKINNLNDLSIFLDDLLELYSLIEFKESNKYKYIDKMISVKKDIENTLRDPFFSFNCIIEDDTYLMYDTLLSKNMLYTENACFSPGDIIKLYRDSIVSSSSIENAYILTKELQSIVLNRLNSQFNDFYRKNEELENKISLEIKELIATNDNKWSDNAFYKEKRFGEYLECYKELTKNQSESNFVIKYSSFLKDFSDFLNNNPCILESYFLWSDIEDSERNDIINIVSNICLLFSEPNL